MKKLLVANWKLNKPPVGLGSLRGGKSVEVVVCPPDVYLQSVGKKLHKSVKLGAQNVFWAAKGAYTGEISPAELKDFGVKYAIIGHSENRKWDKETDEMINKKVLASLKFGLKPILCVGEQKRAANRKGQIANRAKTYVQRQLEKDLRGIDHLPLALRHSLVIAYEPLWAIGAGRPDKPEEAAAMARFIKNILHSTFHIPHSGILYGGSVDSKNIRSFVKFKEIDGALVGGASLKIKEFKKIIRNSSRI